MLIVDTDILIDAARKIPEAVDYLEHTETTMGLAISAVTQMELLVGARDKQAQQTVRHFLARFTVIKLNASISDVAYDLLLKYRLSHGLAIADALIAATAIVTGQPLATKNLKDFRFIKGLTLQAYP